MRVGDKWDHFVFVKEYGGGWEEIIDENGVTIEADTLAELLSQQDDIREPGRYFVMKITREITQVVDVEAEG